MAFPLATPPVEKDMKCVYSDGTVVVAGPPETSCPESVDSRVPFCGGACGYEKLCPEDILSWSHTPAPCGGLSDTRGFGVCALTTNRCAAPYPEYNDEILGYCELAMGEPCACLVPIPQVVPEEEAQGFVVTARVCEQYASFHEGGAACRRADWSLLE
jgi:hypothetical protein